ncbi:elongation factor Tu [Pedobacter sp. AK017]|uniref:hypothetical protein n=1 Tax=Pedobacter sp. AK017 TaxID=2723073 RepID=UPI00160D242F|nr:hypothetical protein [Pedobacter sp. AK017]MBB5440954.1 elongation factor Tu [Pedobacter sp. AK017]
MVKIIVKATITLYNYEKSRKTPFKSGYRPLFSFGSDEYYTSGQIQLLDRDAFFPGDTADVQISFLEELLNNSISVGERFYFKEVKDILGEGIIIEIANRN